MARAIRYQQQMAMIAGDLETAVQFDEEIQRLARLTDDHWAAGASQMDIGAMHTARGNYDEAEQILAEGLIEAPKAGPLIHGFMLFIAGSLAGAGGQYDLAAASLEEAIVILRPVGHAGVIGGALSRLGTIAWLRGELYAARQLHAAALAEYKKRGTRNALVFGFLLAAVDPLEPRDLGIALDRHAERAGLPEESAVSSSLAESLRNLGRLARGQGRLDEASAMIRDSMGLAAEAESETHMVLGVAESVGVAVDRGQTEQAATLLGAAQEHIAASGVQLRSVEQESFNESASAIDDAAAQELGRKSTLAEAVALAINEE